MRPRRSSSRTASTRSTGAYTRTAHGQTLDAAVLMPLGMGYGRWGGPERVRRTIDVIRERLGDGGSLLYRYREDDGLPGDEGFFTPCSFWLAGALAHCGRVDEAAAVLDEVIPLAQRRRTLLGGARPGRRLPRQPAAGADARVARLRRGRVRRRHRRSRGAIDLAPGD